MGSIPSYYHLAFLLLHSPHLCGHQKFLYGCRKNKCTRKIEATPTCCFSKFVRGMPLQKNRKIAAQQMLGYRPSSLQLEAPTLTNPDESSTYTSPSPSVVLSISESTRSARRGSVRSWRSLRKRSINSLKSDGIYILQFTSLVVEQTLF